MAKKKLTDLTGDGKVTQADVLKGRGVFAKGGELEDKMEMMISRTEETPMKKQMTEVMGESEFYGTPRAAAGAG